jgi:N-acetylglucosaminyl-diphospho-decaprenol L-rhamnosyltransferase
MHEGVRVSTPIDLSIIIINYRSAAFTKACLRSIYENNDALHLEIIVVDNASYDGCGAMIAAEFPEVVFIQSAHNLGFAGANNLGIAASHASHLLFLNPDTEVQGKAIDRLFASMKCLPDAGMAGARLLNSDSSVQTSSITAIPSILNQILGTEYLRQAFPKASLWGIKPLFENHQLPVPVDAISGACMMAKRDVVEQAHGFTTDYFMYSEDLDLCLKVKKAGWNVYYVPNAVVVHHGGRSSGSRSESNYAEIMIRRSMYQFMQAHRGRWYAWCFRLASTVAAACRVTLLTLLLPFAIVSRGAAVPRIWKKWAGILGWCIGIQTWTRQQRAVPQNSAAK